jgi:hypothetical protein
MSQIKLKNLLAENMRRFKTKNLNEDETQLDMFNVNPDIEYFHNRPETDDNTGSLEVMSADIQQAMKRKEGKEAIKVAQRLLKYVSTDVYKNLEWAQETGKDYLISDAQFIINAVQRVNQDVIEDAIKVLKVSPQNMPAMQTIYDIIEDLYSAVD